MIETGKWYENVTVVKLSPKLPERKRKEDISSFRVKLDKEIGRLNRNEMEHNKERS